MAKHPEAPSPLKTGHLLRQLKELHFVGREDELALLQGFVSAESSAPPLFYLQGLPGMGKSALLDALRRWLESRPATTYVYVDGRRLETKTAETFLGHLGQALGLRRSWWDLQNILQHLQRLVRKRPVVIAIDSYEQLLSLDNWLRERFLAHLSPKVKVVLAGRRPLPSPWAHSPGWRLLVKHHGLGPLKREEVAELLFRMQVKAADPDRWWHYSYGHPLTLHLMIHAHLEGRLSDPARGLQDPEIALGLLESLSQDPMSPRLKELLLAASWPFAFDRSLLEEIVQSPVTVDEFYELIQCSIVHRKEKAWTVAEPYHSALRTYFLHHDPEKAHHCRQRLVDLEKRRVMERALRGDSVLSLAEFCRWSGDPFLELLATTHEGWGRYQVQRAKASHGPLVAAYLARPLPPITWTFTSPWDGRSISFAQDPQQATKSREAAEIHRHLDDPQSTLWLLLRDGEEVHGLALVRHEGTGIPPALLHLEVSTEDPIALVYLVQKALSPLAEQGAMVIHRPSPPLLHLLRRCGIEPLHERALIQWSPEVLRRFLSGEGGPNSEGDVPPSPHPPKKFPPGWEVLSAREKEVALLVAEGLSNEEVAAKLFVTEATVKKHLTAVYDKLRIRSRSQLILALAPAASKPEKEA